MKRFYITQGIQYTYGNRIFLHEDDVAEMLQGTHCTLEQLPYNSTNPIARVLRENCLWGGSDKRYGDWLGYEVSSNPEDGNSQMKNIVDVLVAEGFEQLTQAPW